MQTATPALAGVALIPIEARNGPGTSAMCAVHPQHKAALPLVCGGFVACSGDSAWLLSLLLTLTMVRCSLRRNMRPTLGPNASSPAKYHHLWNQSTRPGKTCRYSSCGLSSPCGVWVLGSRSDTFFSRPGRDTWMLRVSNTGWAYQDFLRLDFKQLGPRRFT